MSSTLSSVRSSPIPDLAYDSYKSLSLRDQTLLRRQLEGSNNFIGSSVSPGVSNIHEYSDETPPPIHHHQQNLILQDEPLQLHQRHPPNQGSSSNPTTSNNNQSQKTNKGFDMNNPQTARMVHRRPSNFVVQGGKAYSLDSFAGETLAFWILLGILIVLVLGNAILTFIIYGVIRVRTGTESIEVSLLTTIWIFDEWNLLMIDLVSMFVMPFCLSVLTKKSQILWEHGSG